MHFAWSSLVLFCILAMGHAAFVVAIINRLHGLRIRMSVLHRVRQVHDVVIVAGPGLFAWLFGIRGPQLFFGGDWRGLPIPLLAYLAICGAAALVIPVVALRRRFAGDCKLEIARRSVTFDIEREVGFRPVGAGPHRLYTRIRGNQFLQLERTEKEYRLNRLPREWEGLSILHLSDLHFTGTIERAYFEQVVRIANIVSADLVTFTGDLLDREDLIEWIPATLGRLAAPLGCHFVLGNHDWNLTNTDAIRTRLEELGWNDAAGKSQTIEHRDKPLLICGSELPWMGTQPDLATAPADAFRLFLSHTPDNIRWARQNNIDLMLSGHIHGGQVRLPGFGPVYAPSLYGCRYASGTFWEPPTLLHVSRGISGAHPLRWNCLPELTRLILRPASSGDTAFSS